MKWFLWNSSNVDEEVLTLFCAENIIIVIKYHNSTLCCFYRNTLFWNENLPKIFIFPLELFDRFASYLLKLFFKKIYLFMAVLSLRFCARAFSSCGKRGPLFIAVRGPLIIAASLVAEHRLQMHRLSNCGSRAQLLPGMWYPPKPGLEPVSPALAGRFSTTAPPGKPLNSFKNFFLRLMNIWIIKWDPFVLIPSE